MTPPLASLSKPMNLRTLGTGLPPRQTLPTSLLGKLGKVAVRLTRPNTISSDRYGDIVLLTGLLHATETVTVDLPRMKHETAKWWNIARNAFCEYLLCYTSQFTATDKATGKVDDSAHDAANALGSVALTSASIATALAHLDEAALIEWIEQGKARLQLAKIGIPATVTRNETPNTPTDAR